MITKLKTPKKTDSPLDWKIYLINVNCEIVKSTIEGSSPLPPGVSKTEYSMVFLASAISELASAIEILAKKTP